MRSNGFTTWPAKRANGAPSPPGGVAARSGNISTLVGTGTNSRSTPCLASSSRNATMAGIGFLFAVLLAEIAPEHVGERPRVEEESVAARQGLGAGGHRAEPSLERRVERSDLARTRRPTSRRERRAPPARLCATAAGSATGCVAASLADAGGSGSPDAAVAPAAPERRPCIHDEDVVDGLPRRLAAHHDRGRRQRSAADLAADRPAPCRPRASPSARRRDRCCTRDTSTTRAGEPSLATSAGVSTRAFVVVADEARDGGGIAERLRGDPAVDLGEAVAVFVGQRREAMEPGRELDLHPQLGGRRRRGVVQVRLAPPSGERSAGRPAAPSSRARTRGHDVFEAIGAGDVLAGEQLDQRRQRQRVRALLGGQRRRRRSSRSASRASSAPPKGWRRPGACPRRPRASGGGIGVHEVRVVGGEVEAGPRRAPITRRTSTCDVVAPVAGVHRVDIAPRARCAGGARAAARGTVGAPRWHRRARRRPSAASARRPAIEGRLSCA